MLLNLNPIILFILYIKHAVLNFCYRAEITEMFENGQLI